MDRLLTDIFKLFLKAKEKADLTFEYGHVAVTVTKWKSDGEIEKIYYIWFNEPTTEKQIEDMKTILEEYAK